MYFLKKVINFSDSSNNRTLNAFKQNECFLIPSQITLNESNIMDWNPIKVNKIMKIL